MKEKFFSPIKTVLFASILLALGALSVSCSKQNSSSTKTSKVSIVIPESTDNKIAPRGLFLNSTNLPTQNWSRIEKFVLNDPTVSGANIVVPWSKVDRGVDASPQYDWSYVYQQAQPWIDAGKTVNILLWGAAQKAEQEFDGKPITPAYVLKETDTISCQCNIEGECVSDPPTNSRFLGRRLSRALSPSS